MKTAKRVLAMVLAMGLMVVPMQTQAAEAPAAEVQLVELKAEAYYKEEGKEGTFYQYDEKGNIVSSIKVEEAIFKPNATLTSGWGQYKNEGKLNDGTFENATLDTKGYLRGSFTTKSGTVYDKIVVKVKIVDWVTIHSSSNDGSTGSNDGNTGSTGGNSGNADGNDGNTGSNSGSTGSNSGSTGSNSGSTGSNSGSTGSNSGSTGSNSGSTGSNSGSTGSNSGSTGGSTGDPNPDNKGWTDGPTQSGDPNPDNKGWTEQPTAIATEE